MIAQPGVYVEPDCTFTHEGGSFTAGGAVVTPERIIAYPGKAGVLKDWHGNAIGTWRATATWRTPRSYVAGTMSQIVAKVNGATYTGRGAGEGMIFQGKRMARERRAV